MCSSLWTRPPQVQLVIWAKRSIQQFYPLGFPSLLWWHRFLRLMFLFWLWCKHFWHQHPWVSHQQWLEHNCSGGRSSVCKRSGGTALEGYGPHGEGVPHKKRNALLILVLLCHSLHAYDERHPRKIWGQTSFPFPLGSWGRPRQRHLVPVILTVLFQPRARQFYSVHPQSVPLDGRYWYCALSHFKRSIDV